MGVRKVIFCWRVRLTYACGHLFESATDHRCGPTRQGCMGWITNKVLAKQCCDCDPDGGKKGLHEDMEAAGASVGSETPLASATVERGWTLLEPGKEIGSSSGWGEWEGSGMKRRGD